MNAADENAPTIVASTHGVKIALHHFGGRGPTLMICHATGFHARCYLPLMPTLTEHFDVWGLDFRAHGASSAPVADTLDEGFNWSGFAADLLAVIDHLGLESVRAFGHSMGGAAVLLAEKERPGVIDAAFLYEPIVFPPTIVPKNSMMAVAAQKRRAEFASRPEVLMRYASRPPLGTLRADALAAYVTHGFDDTAAGTVTLACRPEHEAATFNGANTSIDDIRDLPVPARIACGGAAAEVNPADFAGPTADALPNAALVTYAGLGHFGPLQDPDRLAADAVEYLRRD